MSRHRPFIPYPEDWIGQIVEVFDDKAVSLDCGLISAEHKAVGKHPVCTLEITPGLTAAQIDDWLRSVMGER